MSSASALISSARDQYRGKHRRRGGLGRRPHDTPPDNGSAVDDSGAPRSNGSDATNNA
jgi:hypothetical protein